MNFSQNYWRFILSICFYITLKQATKFVCLIAPRPDARFSPLQYFIFLLTHYSQKEKRLLTIPPRPFLILATYRTSWTFHSRETLLCQALLCTKCKVFQSSWSKQKRQLDTEITEKLPCHVLQLFLQASLCKRQFHSRHLLHHPGFRSWRASHGL